GRTELGAESYSTALRYQGRDAVGFGVLQLPTANALQVYRDVSNEIERLSKRFPPGLKIDVAFDTTTVVSESIREVITTLVAAIATALVLAAVFVPVAFFPGATGRLYQQFALTIAVSMAISAFNALTLTPSLSALLLGRAEKPKGVFFRAVNRVIDGGTSGLVAALRQLIRR